MDDYINFTEACKRLKIGPRSLVRRIAAAGVPTKVNGLDGREKLIAVADLPRLRRTVVPA